MEQVEQLKSIVKSSAHADLLCFPGSLLFIPIGEMYPLLAHAHKKALAELTDKGAVYN
jgi:hypothetical protein